MHKISLQNSKQLLKNGKKIKVVLFWHMKYMKWSKMAQNLQHHNFGTLHQSCRFSTSNLSKAHETRDSLSSLQVVQVYLKPCRHNSLMKCTLQPKIAKKH